MEQTIEKPTENHAPKPPAEHERTHIAMGIWRIQIFKRKNGLIEFTFSTDQPFPLNTLRCDSKNFNIMPEPPAYDIIENYLTRRFPVIPITVITELDGGKSEEKVLPSITLEQAKAEMLKAAAAAEKEKEEEPV